MDKSSLFLSYKEVFPNFGLFYFDKRRSYYKTVRPRITSGKESGGFAWKRAWRILSTLDRPAVNKTGRNWKWRPAIADGGRRSKCDDGTNISIVQ